MTEAIRTDNSETLKNALLRIEALEEQIEKMKKTILKLRNCMNCKHRDTRCFSSGEDKGVVLCNHWEMKE
jgi:hypothetical protein